MTNPIGVQPPDDFKEEEMKEELKPCPFCNRVPEIKGSAMYSRHWIQCPCGVSTKFFETEKQAIDAWNYRQREKYLTDRIFSLEIDLAHFPEDEYRRANQQLQKENKRYFDALVEVHQFLKESRLEDYEWYFNVDCKDIEYIFDIVDKTLRGEDVKTMQGLRVF